MTLPEPFNPATGAASARSNVMVEVYGRSKTGKTHLVTRCARPLYVVHLDPNDNLDYHLYKAAAEGFEGDVFVRKLPPVRYELLDEAEARRRLEVVWELIYDALNRKAEGGTFVIDGGMRLKGYAEKALVGESPTLGFRPEKGKHAPRTVEYSKSNAHIGEIINAFTGTPLDFAITYEGRRTFRETTDDSGRKSWVPTDKFRSTSHESTHYGLKAQVETLTVLEDIVADNKVVGQQAVPKIRIGWNAYGLHLESRTLPAKTFAELRDLFLMDVPKQEAKLDPPGAPVVEVSLDMEE